MRSLVALCSRPRSSCRAESRGGEPGSFAKVDDPVLAAGAHEGAHLKLALWMGGDGIPANSENLVEASIDALPVTSTLDLILASADQGRVSIELTLNGNPGYLLYTPCKIHHGAVVELENTLLAAELPALGDVRALLAGGACASTIQRFAGG